MVLARRRHTGRAESHQEIARAAFRGPGRLALGRKAVFADRRHMLALGAVPQHTVFIDAPGKRHQAAQRRIRARRPRRRCAMRLRFNVRLISVGIVVRGGMRAARLGDTAAHGDCRSVVGLVALSRRPKAYAPCCSEAVVVCAKCLGVGARRLGHRRLRSGL